jgi:hypothetical protein
MQTESIGLYDRNLVIYPKNNAKINMGTKRTNVNTNKYSKFLNADTINNINGIAKEFEHDELYTGNEDLLKANLEIHKINVKKIEEERRKGIRLVRRLEGDRNMRYFDNAPSAKYIKPRRRVKRDDDPCEPFYFTNPDQKQIKHPVRKDNSSNSNYASSVDCYAIINGK